MAPHSAFWQIGFQSYPPPPGFSLVQLGKIKVRER